METYINYLNSEVDRGIYVRGAQGQNLLEMSDPEKWIREMETTRRSDYAQHKEEYDRNADRAIVFFRRRLAEGVDPIRAFDCSGLTMYYAQNLCEIVNDDYNAASIYIKLCSAVSGPPTIRGQLVFRSSNGKPSKIVHMGTYVGNGMIVECKGRDDGVIRRAYRESDWTHVGEWRELMQLCADPHPISKEQNGEPIRLLQEALNALDYTDADCHPLDADGKYGKKTANALERMIRYNLPELRLITPRDGSMWAYAEKI